jgi:hypothetical protein
LQIRCAVGQVVSFFLSHLSDRAVRGLDAEEQLQKIVAILRRFPYWIPGHLKAARLQLDLGLIRPGYSAAKLVLASSIASPSERDKAHSLLGRALLGAGRAAEALDAFGYPQADLKPDDLEDIAAALMAVQRYGEAREILLRKESKGLSQPGRAALDFLNSKTGDVESKSTEQDH